MFTVDDIAASLGAVVHGDGAIVVEKLAEPSTASIRELALAMSPRFSDALEQGQAIAAVLWEGADWEALGLKAAIIVPRPRLALAGLTQIFDQTAQETGISPHAVIADDAIIGAQCSIGPFTVIAQGAIIGDGCVIASHVTVGQAAKIGAGSRIAAGCRVEKRAQIGKHAVLHPNVVIGADGFSFVTRTPSNPEIGRRTLGRKPFTAINDPEQHRIHSLGGVMIGDHVEIGANSTIDAGTIRPTQVGHGTKIDNLVQVGHNVTVGDHCMLCAQTAVAGSARIGDRCVLGGKSGVADNTTIGDDCVIGGAAIVLSDVAAGQFMMGYPALPMMKYRAREKALRQLSVNVSQSSKS